MPENKACNIGSVKNLLKRIQEKKKKDSDAGQD